MVDFHDRRPWSYTTPSDADFEVPLDLKSKRAANARLRSEDKSEHYGAGVNVTNKAISLTRRRAKRTGEYPLTVGEYLTSVQEHLPGLVQEHVYRNGRVN